MVSLLSLKIFGCFAFTLFYIFLYGSLAASFISGECPVNVNALGITWYVSHVIPVVALGFHLIFRSELKDKIKQFFVPLFLLCEWSNILSIIILLEAWPNNIDTTTYIQYQTIVCTTIVIMTMCSYMDVLFIYHKLRCTETKLQQHTDVFLACIAIAVNIVAFPSMVHSFLFSKSFMLHFFSICGFVMIVSIVPNREPKLVINIENKSRQRAMQWLADLLLSTRLAAVAMGLFLIKTLVQPLYWYMYYDSETCAKMWDQYTNYMKEDIRIISVRLWFIYVLTIIRSCSLNERIFPKQQMGSNIEQANTSDVDGLNGNYETHNNNYL